MNVFDLMAKLGLDTSEYENGLKRAKEGSTTFGSVLKANLVTKGIELVSKGLVKASQEMVAFAKASVQTGAQFDEAMSQVAATMGTTVDQIGELRDFAQEMGSKTAFSATQAAEALNYMALAGYNAETAMAMLPNVLNLAAAGGIDLAQASDMVTDAQSALGLTMSQTNEMVDQMAATASKSNTSVQQLGEAFLTIGATARNLKGGTQELSTILGVLADNGIKGAEGGTHLRNMLLSLQSPTSDAQKLLDQYNISLYDSDGEMRSMVDIIGDLQGALEGMDTASKDAVIGGIFNKTDLAAVNALVGTSQERFKELGIAIRDSTGAAEAMANTQLDNLNGDITLMQSALEGVKIQFSDGITPAIRNVVQTVTKALSKRSTMKYINELGKKIGDLTKTLTGKLMNTLPKIMSLFDDGGKKIKAVTSFAIALEAIINPAAGLTHGLMLAVGAIGASALAADDARKRFGKLTEAQRDNIETALDAVDAYNELKESRDERIAAIEDETNKTSELWQELQSLAGADGSVAEADEEHARVLIDQLNDALGTELELVDGQIKGYDDLAKSIENMLEKKKAESMYAAVSESAEQARKNLDGVQEALYDQRTEIDNLNKQVDFYNQRIADTIADENMNIDTKQQLINGYEAQRDALKGQVDAAEADYERLRNAETQAYEDMALADQAYTLLMEGEYAKVAELIANDTTNRLQHKIETGNITEQEIQDLERSLGVAREAAERYQDELQAGNESYTQEQLDAMNQHVADLEELLAKANEEFSKAGTEGSEEYTTNIADGTGEAAASADTLASGATSSLWARVADFAAAGRASRDAYVSNLGEARGAWGSFAIGNDYVPTNNYPALLHRGEAVLTAREADEWRRGGSGKQSAQPIQLTLETPVEIDGAVIAKKTYRYILDESNNHGAKLIMA